MSNEKDNKLYLRVSHVQSSRYDELSVAPRGSLWGGQIGHEKAETWAYRRVSEHDQKKEVESWCRNPVPRRDLEKCREYPVIDSTDVQFI